jgi:hypothetical protein
VINVVYIYLGNYHQESGVTKKLSGWFNAFDKQKISWKLFALSSNVEKEEVKGENYNFLPMNYLTEPKQLYNRLSSFVSENKADVYLFRYPLANRHLYKLCKNHKQVFTIEHNTKELPEVWHQAFFWVRKFKVRPTPSYLKLIYKTLVVSVFEEWYYGKKVLSLARNGIAVTNEISKYELSRYSNYHCKVVANGIDTTEVKYFNRQFTEGEILNIVIIVDAPVAWHGIDLILESINKYNGNRKFELVIIGSISEADKVIAQKVKQVNYVGYLQNTEREVYFQNAHIGLGSFALYRKKLNEASTLKVREYLASGLPVCIGHKDTDIELSNVFKKYCFTVDTQVEALNFEKLYNWAVEIYKDKTLNKQIREEAEYKLDFSTKVKALL